MQLKANKIYLIPDSIVIEIRYIDHGSCHGNVYSTEQGYGVWNQDGTFNIECTPSRDIIKEITKKENPEYFL